MRPLLLAPTLALLLVVPAVDAAARETTTATGGSLRITEMRDALRDRSDRELEFLLRSTEAQIRDVAVSIDKLQEALDEPNVLLVDTRSGVQPLDLNELDVLLPIYPLYAAGSLRGQLALERTYPELVALHRAALIGLISPADLLGFTPEQRRSHLTSAAFEQRRSQGELAASALADHRRDLAHLRTFAALLEEVIAARMPPGAAPGTTRTPPDQPAAQETSITMQIGFDGVWSSTYGRELVLTQSGNVVTGTYDDGHGRVRFEITGDRTLEGYWVGDKPQDKCDSVRLGSAFWGRIALVFNEDMTSYDGLWGYCDDSLPEQGYGYWRGSYIGPQDRTGEGD